MSKIIQAVNSMISNSPLIDSVMYGDSNELFFVYKNKYKWSIKLQDDGNYSLWFYPGDVKIQDLVHIEGHEWEAIPMIHYSTKELPQREAIESFNELYKIVKEKVFGMDQVLDDIY